MRAHFVALAMLVILIIFIGPQLVQAMTALLYDLAGNPDYRAAVKGEFDGSRALLAEYLRELEKTYTVPLVAEPTAK